MFEQPIIKNHFFNQSHLYISEKYFFTGDSKVGNYTYSETTPGEEFRNKETNELKPPTRLIWTASNWTKMKCD